MTSILGIDGVNPTLNSGRILAELKSGAERSETVSEIIRRWKAQATTIDGMKVFFQPVQDLTVEDRVTRAEYQYLVESPDQAWLERTLHSPLPGG